MKKLSLLLISFLIIPCMFVFGACNQQEQTPPKQITSIAVGYVGTDFAHYPANANMNTMIEVEYGKNISVDFTDFQINLKFDDNTQTTLTPYDAIINYGIKITHNIPATSTPTPRGDYDLTFTTPNNIHYTATCRVIHKLIELPIANPLTYTGEALQPSFHFLDDDEDYVELVDYDEDAINVDTYSATYRILDPENCLWFPSIDANQTDQTFSWSISRKVIELPTAQKLTYTGEEQEISIENFDPNLMSVSGTTTATVVNETPLEAIVSLTDTTNCKWEDGTTTPKTLEWNLSPKPVTKPDLDTSITLTYNGEEQTAPIQNLNNNIIITGNTGTNKGEYTAYISLVDDINYVWSDTTNTEYTIIWKIEKGNLNLNIPFESTPLTAVYGTLKKDVDITALQALYPGKWNIQDGYEEEYVGNVKDNGKNVIWFTYTDESGNYQPYSVKVPVRVKPIILTKPTFDGATEFTYDGNEHTVTIIGIDEETMTFSGLTKDEDTYTSTKIDADKYTITISLKNWENYNWANESPSYQYLSLEWSIKHKELEVTNNTPDYIFTIAQDTPLTLDTFKDNLPFTINLDLNLVNVAISTTSDKITFKITLKCWDAYIEALKAALELDSENPQIEITEPINYIYPDLDLDTFDGENLTEVESYYIELEYDLIIQTSSNS